MDINIIREQFELLKQSSHLSDNVLIDINVLEWLIKDIELSKLAMDRMVEIDEEKNKKFKELTNKFRYAVEHTDDFSDFYEYMSEITYGKGNVKKYG